MEKRRFDYVKSVLANKATLAGYILGIGGAASAFYFNDNKNIVAPSAMSLIAGQFLLTFTLLGVETMKTYQRTREVLKNEGNVPNRFKERKMISYCNRKGFELAVKEAGLESQLKYEEAV
ncbi:MAG: hypothetical protein AABW51_04515 [Nanoarchaeota archaeon]